MKLHAFTAISAAAFLAGSLGIAAAQTGSGSQPGTASQTKCWDQATKTIKDKSASARTGTTGSNVGSGSSSNTGSMGSRSDSTTGSADTATRPPAAAGLPNCM